ncbi:MAG: class I SAM-dependent methyltransferase [Acidobacteriales bacterium]|nr:class I SAM-dependent methyltransferase [Terriglobales bacterium]
MSTQAIRQYFEAMAPRWDTLPAPPDAGEKVRRFVERAVPSAAERVLDIGSGTGLLLPHLMGLRPGLREVVEVDLAEAMLREARLKGDDRIRFLCADAVRLPLAEASFDAVLCFGVLPHVHDLDAACRGFLSALKPGGVLAVGHMMDSTTLNEFHATLDGPVSGDRIEPAANLAARLEALGARVETVEEETGWYYVAVSRKDS